MKISDETNRVLVSEYSPEGFIDIYLSEQPLKAPDANEVTVRLLASSINPSDVGLMLGAGDIASATQIERSGQPCTRLTVPRDAVVKMAGRSGLSLPVGNEGCGIVVAAGTSPEAQALKGKTVAIMGGATFARFRTLPLEMCMVLPDGLDPKEGAASFVNPLSSLSFVETMKLEGFGGIVHAAAASNLGQMLVKICKADGVPLVNIVRSQDQVRLLRDIGATHVVDSTSEDFASQLVEAIAETGAFLAFDPVGGGLLTNQILDCMEQAALREAQQYSRYGTECIKQVYIYGGLDKGITPLTRDYGMAWKVGGWNVLSMLRRFSPEVVQQMYRRVATELTTTFKSEFGNEIALDQVLDPAVLREISARRTGNKYLICTPPSELGADDEDRT